MWKKRFSLFVAIILIFSITLTGCKGKEDKKVTKEKGKEEPKIEDFPHEITILEPEDPYEENMQMTFTNNSDYIVTEYMLTIELEGEEILFLDDTTVLPGETSPIIKDDGPESGKEEDIKAIEYFIYFQDEEGNKKMLGYDVKSDKSKIVEIPHEKSQEVKEIEKSFDIKDVPYEIEIVSETGSVKVAEGVFENKSDYIVVDYSLEFLLKDENEKTIMGTDDTVLPGETSPKFSVLAPESEKEEDMELLRCYLIIQDEDGKEYDICYDVKLDEYEIFDDLDEY